MDKQQKIDALFAKAKLAPTAIPFTESKGAFIKNVEAGVSSLKVKAPFFNLKNILIMIGILGAMSFLISISITGKEASEAKFQDTELQHKVITVNDSINNTEPRIDDSFANSKDDEELWVNLIKPLPVREIYLKRELILIKQKSVSPKYYSQKPDQIQFPLIWCFRVSGFPRI